MNWCWALSLFYTARGKCYWCSVQTSTRRAWVRSTRKIFYLLPILVEDVCFPGWTFASPALKAERAGKRTSYEIPWLAQTIPRRSKHKRRMSFVAILRGECVNVHEWWPCHCATRCSPSPFHELECIIQWESHGEEWGDTGKIGLVILCKEEYGEMNLHFWAAKYRNLIETLISWINRVDYISLHTTQDIFASSCCWVHRNSRRRPQKPWWTYTPSSSAASQVARHSSHVFMVQYHSSGMHPGKCWLGAFSICHSCMTYLSSCEHENNS
jgi:hypothetical protein